MADTAAAAESAATGAVGDQVVVLLRHALRALELGDTVGGEPRDRRPGCGSGGGAARRALELGDVVGGKPRGQRPGGGSAAPTLGALELGDRSLAAL